jgi:hypothetical protein
MRKQSWLMLAEAEECNQYIPQFGDEVAYLRQVISHGQICYSFTPWSWMYVLFGFEDLIPSNLEFQFLIMLVQTNVLV